MKIIVCVLLLLVFTVIRSWISLQFAIIGPNCASVADLAGRSY